MSKRKIHYFYHKQL